MTFLRKTEADPADETSTADFGTSAETAEYIEDMAHQLERLAARSKLTRLRELLSEARKEARRRAFG